MSEDIRFLSSDEMEGRGPGTQGLQKAGDYVRDEFRRLGVKSGPADGSYRQTFQVSIGSRTVTEQTSLALRGPDGQAWKLEMGRDFQPLAAGGSGRVQGPLVFAGYGISASKLGYDDFDGLGCGGQDPAGDSPRTAAGRCQQQVRRPERDAAFVCEHQAAEGQGAQSSGRAVGQRSVHHCDTGTRRSRAANGVRLRRGRRPVRAGDASGRRQDAGRRSAAGRSGDEADQCRGRRKANRRARFGRCPSR